MSLDSFRCKVLLKPQEHTIASSDTTNCLDTNITLPLLDIDPEPTPAERAAAEALIAMERSTIPDDQQHALLPPAITPQFTSFVNAELDRISSSTTQPPEPTRAIDLNRYQAPDPSSSDLEAGLNQAYTAMSYLSARRQHLALLDSYGKNAWLTGNWQLEAELKAVERELAATRREIDVLTVRRQRVQGEVSGELRGLEEGWRRGVGRVLETEVAAEGVRRNVVEEQRRRVQGA